MALLRSIWERAVTERQPHLVTVLGPPGIGKTRLGGEISSLIEDWGYRVLRGRCLPYETADVQEALSVSPHVPVIQCDARERTSTRDALTTLVEHALAKQLGPS